MASIYQQEVAEMDRRHHLRIRVLSFLGAATLIIVAFWSAGLPPTKWYARLHRWFVREQTLKVQTPSSTTADSEITPIPAPTLAPAKSKPLPGADSSISSVPLPLYLIATSPGRNIHEGTARIGTSPESPQTYGAGAILANGARLTEIHRDKVVLESGGHRVTIFTRDSRGQNKIDGAESLAYVGGAAVPVSQPTLHIDRLTDIMRIGPYYDGERLAGLEIYPGQNRSLFSMAGLQAGDVITSINGAPVADAAYSMEQLRTVLDGAALQAALRRKATIVTIAIDGRLIARELEKSRLKQPVQDATPRI